MSWLSPFVRNRYAERVLEHDFPSPGAGRNLVYPERAARTSRRDTKGDRTPPHHSGRLTSAAKTPGSLARFRKPSYFSTTAATRFMPRPWLPRFSLM